MEISKEAILLAAAELRPILEMAKMGTGDITDIYSSRDLVLARFQPIFSVEHIPQLTTEEFLSFLVAKNNHHWSGLHRKGPQITSDMKLLRKALSILLDENQSIEKRLDTLRPFKKLSMVRNFGRAFITPILMVAYPDKYGVMNNPSTEGARLLNILPKSGGNTPFSKKYIDFNNVLLALASELNTDLWTLDALWWGLIRERSKDSDNLEIPISREDNLIDGDKTTSDNAGRFVLEKYLQEFMRDNWDNIPELKSWKLYEEDDEIVGFEYNTNSIGRIDLLANHKTENKWLVIELKRNQSSDDTVGQVQRYMGWVREHLAKKGDVIRGLIVSREKDDKLKYALMYANNVEVMLYEVNFNLRYPPKEK